jgi:probable HAF family extracellular repeat protein
MKSLGVIAEGGGASSNAWATSSNGSVVVGDCRLPSNNIPEWRGFRWTAANGASELQPYTSQSNRFYSSARAVTADGNTTFGSSSSSNGTVAVMWNASGSITVLGAADPNYGSAATTCTPTGTYAAGQQGGQAIRWQVGGSSLTIAGLGVERSIAYSISDQGNVITGDCTVGGNTQAFRWTQSEGMVRLGLLQGGDYSQGYGMTADGSVIVGQAAVASGSHAFIWTQTTGMLDLNTYLTSMGVDMTGWTLKYARAISANGTTIAGAGTFNGNERAFVVTGLAIPTPSAVALITLSTLCTRRRRD